MHKTENFIRVVFLSVSSEESDLLSFELFELGAQGVSEALSFVQTNQQYDPEILNQESVKLNAFFEISYLEKLESLLQTERFYKYKPQIFVEEEKDWLKEWKKHYKPLHVTADLWVYPAWEKDKIEEKQKVILIDPGLAFGTGTHATTLLCLKALHRVFFETKNKKNFKTALDMGAGTGILSIFMRKEGVSVTACEIDGMARENGRKNLELNAIKDVAMVSPEDLKDKTFDLVVANIIDGVLLKIKKDLLEYTTSKLVLSGILRENESEVVEAFLELGFKLTSKAYQDEWLCLELDKNL